FDVLLGIVLFRRVDEADVALVDQIEKEDVGVPVTLGIRDDEAKVRLDELFEGRFIVLLNQAAELTLTLRCEAGNPRDFLEILIQEIVRIVSLFVARHSDWSEALYARKLFSSDARGVLRIGNFAGQHLCVDDRANDDRVILRVVREQQHFEEVAAQRTGPDHRRLAGGIVSRAHQRYRRRRVEDALEVDVAVSLEHRDLKIVHAGGMNHSHAEADEGDAGSPSAVQTATRSDDAHQRIEIGARVDGGKNKCHGDQNALTHVSTSSESRTALRVRRASRDRSDRRGSRWSAREAPRK